jgi:predicted unusual protein kinase regulating ubiquinone biosynthesis (AarF/ABC1/UbiB family)
MCFRNYINCINFLLSIYKLFYNETDANIEYVKHTAELCGPIGKKLLQFIVMHEGILSTDSKDKLTYIFENCPTHSWKETEMQYFHDHGRYIHNDFLINNDDTIPIGSGTIGQVYRLFSLEHNKYVALKIRHSNVEYELCIFVKTITRVLNAVNMITFIPFTILIHDFLENIHNQLDYKNEAFNTTLLRKNNVANPHIIIPEIYYCSESTICMSYHDGIPFTEIQDISTKNKIAHDMFLFNMSSLLIYDFLHCDLHYGNWKVNIDNDGNYTIIIYDCGIMGSTNSDEINKKICMSCMDGDYNTIFSIVAKDLNTPNGILMTEYTQMIMKKNYKTSTDRFSDFLKQLLIYRIKFNSQYLTCTQGLMKCLGLLIYSSEKLTKVLGKEGSRLEVLVCYYSGILEKTKLYPELLDYLNNWIKEDPSIEIVFYDWLEEYFGHRDKTVFIDVILHKLTQTPT